MAQIGLVLGAASPPASHSLAVHTLPFRALATLAARAPLGGERELVMACFMAARLLDGAVGAAAGASEARIARADAARGWFAALTLPKRARTVFARALEASATNDPDAMVQAVGLVIEETAHVLDAGARREMEELGERIAAAAHRSRARSG